MQVGKIEQLTQNTRMPNFEAPMCGSSSGQGYLGGKFKRFVVETEGDNPVTIATITDDDLEPSDGYVIRCLPS